MKLFLNDIGLLDSMFLSTGIREKMLMGEQTVNYGAPYENVVAQNYHLMAMRKDFIITITNPMVRSTSLSNIKMRFCQLK